MRVGGGRWLECSAVPWLHWRWREHRLEGVSVGSITRFQPDPLQSLGNDHRHPIVQWGHQAVGLRRDHAAGLHFTAIGADPAVPDTGQPEQLPVSQKLYLILIRSGQWCQINLVISLKFA